jgi:DNA phosphorothioation-dependent restriction protein DptG
MDDRNGKSLGVLFTLPDRFVYVAAVAEKEHIIYEEFIIDKISNFATLTKEEQIHSIKFNICSEDVIVKGYEMRIADDFIQRRKSSGIILLNSSPRLN